MNWRDVGRKVLTMAPKVGAVMLNPAGAAAAQAGKWVSEALGVPDTPEDVARGIERDPEAAIRLAEIERKYEVELTKALADENVAMAQIEFADRGSARKREIALRDRVPAALAIIIVLGFFVVTLLTMTGFLNAEKDIVIYLLGILSAALGQVLSYYFGSSRGSDQKTDIISRTTGAAP